MTLPRRVAIVGGGITGLSAAFALERARTERGVPVETTVFEASERLGGNVRTERAGAFLIDAGPDGFVRTKPHAEALCRAVGLGDQLVETLPEHRGFYTVHRGRLTPWPKGLVLIAPAQPGPLLRSPLMSRAGKLRLALDLVLPRAKSGREESISGFVSRRLGPEAVEALAEPLLAGIHAGDPDVLSIRATFPQLEAMEREHGGLIRGARAARKRDDCRRSPGSPAPSVFLSLRGGMDELISALTARLPAETVRTACPVNALVRTAHAQPWRLEFANRVSFEADRVLLAVPCHAAATLLEPLDSPAETLLREVPHLSTATVFLAFRRDQLTRPLDAAGFVVPRREHLRITASTWISSKWPGRAPEDQVLIRAFFGGARDPQAPDMSDEVLLNTAREDLASLAGIRGQPAFGRVYRYLRASPQMVVGHGTRMSRLRDRLAILGGVHAAGGGYDGVGLPDCIQQGQEAAERILGEIYGAR